MARTEFSQLREAVLLSVSPVCVSRRWRRFGCTSFVTVRRSVRQSSPAGST
jgi:hypothetical protein